MSPLNNQFLSQVAEFIKVALDINDTQQDELLLLKKQATIDEINREKYKIELRKAANDLYNSDFLTDETEKRAFVKRASEDPTYVVQFLSKISQAADVAQLGKPARVSSKFSKEAMSDPVMVAAFGLSSTSPIVDD